jgi:hypothetical protein
VNGAQYALLMESGEHPAWCERGHHCTAAAGGEHASAQHVLRGRGASAVVTRYRPARGGAGTVEVRLVVRVPGVGEAAAAAWLSGLCEAVWATVQAYPRP